jgi:hypothetical protein
MRRSWILRDLPVSPSRPSSVSSLPACWALAPAIALPDAWQSLVDRAVAELDFDSRLWIAREQLWPLLGVASLAHMRRPRRATDYHGVQVPTAGAFPQLGADGGPGITPFWLFTAGERRRLLQDFPLPSPPYKSRAAKAPQRHRQRRPRSWCTQQGQSSMLPLSVPARLQLPPPPQGWISADRRRCLRRCCCCVTASAGRRCLPSTPSSRRCLP